MSSSLKDELASLKIDRSRNKQAYSAAAPVQEAPQQPRTAATQPQVAPEPPSGYVSYRPTAAKPVRKSLVSRVFGKLLILIPLAIVGGGAYVVREQVARIRPTTEVKFATVQQMTESDLDKVLSAKGYLRSRNQAQVGAKAPGRVELMAVEEGDRVKAGQILAVLEHNDLKASMASRRASVMRTKAELTEAMADLRDKERKVKREETLVVQYKTSSREEYEAIVAQRDMSAARVEALKANMEFMEASVQEINENIQNMHILAPFEGTVLAKGAEVGETITPGGMGAASGRGSVVTLANLQLLEVETDISESQLAKVRVGQPAEVMVTAAPNKRYQGKVRKIVPLGDRARGTVKVYVQITDPDEKLFPELVSIVNFLPTTDTKDRSTQMAGLFLPRAAVIEQDGKSSVWRIDPDKTIHKITILTTPRSDDLVKVEDGLKAGERVVLSPKPELGENDLVSIPD
jgi:RND family efflux transporter MFP subunit